MLRFLLESCAEFDPLLVRHAVYNRFQPVWDNVVPQIDRDDLVRHQTEEPIESFLDMNGSGTVRFPATTDARIRRRPRQQAINQHIELILLQLHDPIMQQIRFQRLQDTDRLIFFGITMANFINCTADELIIVKKKKSPSVTYAVVSNQWKRAPVNRPMIAFAASFMGRARAINSHTP